MAKAKRATVRAVGSKRVAGKPAKKRAVKKPPSVTKVVVRTTKRPRRVAAAKPREALWSVKVLSVDDTQSGNPDTSPGTFDARILAEGDSWFTIGAIPSSNLLFELRFPRTTAIVNIAYPGDTLKRIADLRANPELAKMLTDPKFGWRWHAIVLSGGGNDLIDRAGELLRVPPAASGRKPGDYIDAAALGALVEEVQQGYREIVALRDSTSLNAGVPIVVHTYDYATSRNSPARFLFVGFLGPWLHRAFEAARVPEGMRARVADRLFNAVADGIVALGRELPAFHVVDTRNTLARAAPGAIGTSGDWLNEIHPTPAGYAKIAARLQPEIEKAVKQAPGSR
jgi:lysophospholipase L1-like esterase